MTWLEILVFGLKHWSHFYIWSRNSSWAFWWLLLFLHFYSNYTSTRKAALIQSPTHPGKFQGWAWIVHFGSICNCIVFVGKFLAFVKTFVANDVLYICYSWTLLMMISVTTLSEATLLTLRCKYPVWGISQISSHSWLAIAVWSTCANLIGFQLDQRESQWVNSETTRGNSCWLGWIDFNKLPLRQYSRLLFFPILMSRVILQVQIHLHVTLFVYQLLIR